MPFTVTFAVATAPSEAVAVMTTFPSFTGTMTPSPSTRATPASDERKVTFSTGPANPSSIRTAKTPCLASIPFSVTCSGSNFNSAAPAFTVKPAATRWCNHRGCTTRRPFTKQAASLTHFDFIFITQTIP